MPEVYVHSKGQARHWHFPSETVTSCRYLGLDAFAIYIRRNSFAEEVRLEEVYPSSEDSKTTLLKLCNPLKEEKQMNGLKKFFEKHQDTLYMIAIVVLVDHFFLKGALRARIEKTLTGLLDGLPRSDGKEGAQ